jgi:ComF family protein
MEALFDLLFPPRCAGCGRGGHWLCPACLANISPPLLKLETPEPLAGLWVAGLYDHPLDLAIHALKYAGKRRLAEPLGHLLAETYRREMAASWPPDAVLPVPLHARRQAERGYNQSALLARVLSREVGLPLVEDALRRARYTQQQVGLSAAQRRKNVSGAFVCAPDYPLVVGRRLLLLDDVCTTGATISACAEALLTAGARQVWGLVLARPML